jgi:hypothetical protein
MHAALRMASTVKEIAQSAPATPKTYSVVTSDDAGR